MMQCYLLFIAIMAILVIRPTRAHERGFLQYHHNLKVTALVNDAYEEFQFKLDLHNRSLMGSPHLVWVAMRGFDKEDDLPPTDQ